MPFILRIGSTVTSITSMACTSTWLLVRDWYNDQEGGKDHSCCQGLSSLDHRDMVCIYSNDHVTLFLYKVGILYSFIHSSIPIWPTCWLSCLSIILFWESFQVPCICLFSIHPSILPIPSYNFIHLFIPFHPSVHPSHPSIPLIYLFHPLVLPSIHSHPIHLCILFLNPTHVLIHPSFSSILFIHPSHFSFPFIHPMVLIHPISFIHPSYPSHPLSEI